MLSRRHTYNSDRLLVAFWCGINFIYILIHWCWISQPVSFPQVEASSKWSGLCYNNLFYCNTYWTVLGMGNWIENRFPHMFPMLVEAKMRSGLYPFFPSRTSEWFRELGIMNQWLDCSIWPIVRPLHQLFLLLSIPIRYCDCWNLRLRHEASSLVAMVVIRTVCLVACFVSNTNRLYYRIT